MRTKKWTFDEADEVYGDKRFEIINGDLYLLESNTIIHQEIVGFILFEFGMYLRNNRDKGEVIVSPFDVFLKGMNDKSLVVQPDILAVLDRKRLKESGCDGAPDLVVEVSDSNTMEKDSGIKKRCYWEVGVREYWLIDILMKRIHVFIREENENDWKETEYSFTDRIPVGIYDGDLIIDFNDLDIEVGDN